MKKKYLEKIITKFLVLVVIFCVGNPCQTETKIEAATAEEREENYKPNKCIAGDINANGTVELSDANATLNYALGICKTDEYGTFVADINGDGTILLDDANQCLKMGLAIETEKELEVIDSEDECYFSFFKEHKKGLNNYIEILTTEEELKREDPQIYEKYKNCIENKNILVIYMQVCAEEPNQEMCSIVVNGKNILVQFEQPDITKTDKMYKMTNFVCIDKSLTVETANIFIENKQINHKADVISMSWKDGPNGGYFIDREEAPFVHILKTEEDVKTYKTFLKDTFPGIILDSFEFVSYLEKKDAQSFERNQYIVCTLPNQLCCIDCIVTDFVIEEGTAKVNIKYVVDEEIAPGDISYAEVLFIKIPESKLQEIEDVQVEIEEVIEK